MKTLLICVILSVALSIRAATGVPTEAEQKDNPAPNPEVTANANAAAAVAAAREAGQPQARFQFCLDGWLSYRGSCYLLVNDPASWRDAEGYCANFGGSLAAVHSVWEYKFLQQIVRTGGNTFAWIGGYYFQNEWRWEDGSLFDYFNWQSVSSPNQNQCLQLNAQDSLGWSNNQCGLTLPFVCQVKTTC